MAHYPVVIIGSGFGGSVMTYRLAEAGLSVCLLERGRAYPPGSFLRNPYQMQTNFWDPSEGMYGLYNVWAFEGLDAIVSSGLGGGSLIYANVMLRKDERWFVKEDLYHNGYEYWPVTRADLDPHYDRVEKMLHGQPYPFERSPYAQTPKTAELKQAAERLGMNWFLPRLAITFANPGEDPVPGEPIHEDPDRRNMHGRTRYTCRLCAECMIGCNYGSKNTLDYNYLSEAQRLGAEIKTLCEVRSFEPRDGGGYAVHYVQHDLEREGEKVNTHDPSVLPLQTITADRLVLAAGTFGSTFLLLKNRDFFPHISRQLGTHFSGNGDLLSFAVKCGDTSGGTRKPRIIDPSYGPVITSAIRFPDEVDGGAGRGRGFYIEDGGYPGSLSWTLQTLDISSALWSWRGVAKRLLWRWLRKTPQTDLSGAIAKLLGSSELSAGLLPMLAMGRDIPDGHLLLLRDRLQCDWRKDRSGAYFERVMEMCERISDALGAAFLRNPSWYLSRLITVHPLGGCPMGRHEAEGVVNAFGEVFNYPGLYIADGSVMPGPVGPNPSLTIAALADRFGDRIIDDLI